MTDWTGQARLAVVTGSAGIGLGVAERLLADGYGVLLCGISPGDNAAARTRTAGRPIEVVELDVSAEAQVAALAAGLRARIGGLDALVNCAGIQPYGTIETTTPADWRRTIEVNLTGYYLMAHFLYPFLKARGSAAIVNIASVQGHQNQRNVLAYATSKGAIHAFTRAMAVDAARDNIRVNCISPGSIRTPLLEFAARELTPLGGDPETTLQGFGAAHAKGRVGTTAEVAAMVAFLIGPEAGFCVGGDFPVDGGLRAQLGV